MLRVKNQSKIHQGEAPLQMSFISLKSKVLQLGWEVLRNKNSELSCNPNIKVSFIGVCHESLNSEYKRHIRGCR